MTINRSKATIELGKKLVVQLNVSDDFLSSWMAHYIAQKIEEVEKTTGKTRAEAEDSCAKAILDIWKHRNSLPPHLRPLGEIEPILRTLAALDVDKTDYRYHAQSLREAATANVDDVTKQWLELVFGIDYTARILIQFSLRAAAQQVVNKAAPWVDLAIQATADDPVERVIIRLAREGAVHLDPENQASTMKERLDRLDRFIQLATAIASSIRTELNAPDPH